LHDKVKALVTVLGHELPISSFRDATLARRYIATRMAKGAGDRTIARELKTLVRALKRAKSMGLWSGELDAVIPDDFEPSTAPMGDSITRPQARQIFPHLSPDSAAAMAFALATASEMSALRHALRSDIPDDLEASRAIRVRGTKNAARDDLVPLVTDEQRVLLAFAREHGCGKEGRLFGNLHRFPKELREACVAEQITHVSPHDLRRSAGQWMVDLAVPIELVSKFMRHTSVETTMRFYASVQRIDLTDRILDAIDPRYAAKAHASRTHRPVVPTLDAIPAPRRSGTLYEVDGVARTLTEWSQASGIPKPTLLYRVTTAGRSMANALAMGRANQRARRTRTPAPEGSASVEDGSTAAETAAVLRQSPDPEPSRPAAPGPRETPRDRQSKKTTTAAPVPQYPRTPPEFADISTAPAASAEPQERPETTENPARPRGLEPPTNGLEDSVGRRIRRGKMRDASIRA
jgi:integrase